MARNKRRTGDTGQAIREAVGGIFSCGVFSPNDFELPAGVGTQLSMTGVTRAYGNAGSFDDAALADVLASYPALRRTGRACQPYNIYSRSPCGNMVYISYFPCQREI